MAGPPAAEYVPAATAEYVLADAAPFEPDDGEETPASPKSSDAPPPSPSRRKRAPPSTVAQWSALLRAPSELWWVYVVKLLFSYAHFSTGILLTLWLSSALGLSDTAAGFAYGLGGLCATLWGVVGGAFVDRAGVARALKLGCLLAVVARGLLISWPSIPAAVIALALVLPLADSLGIPVLTIAVKRCVPKENPAASLAFSLFYVAQNVAALVAGLAIDSFRHALAAGKFPMFTGRPFALYELVFASGGIATALSWFIVWTALPSIEAGPRAVNRAGRRLGILEACWRVWAQESFQRFARLAMILLGVSMIYRHLDATLPKYMLRVFGPDAPYGRYYALEPFIVIFAVPLAGTFITLKLYSTLILGTLIAAFSPFWMCLANKTVFVGLFVVTLSIGESIYSPRVYQYTMAVSDDGAEGVYSALGNVPLFAVNLVAGTMSGFLLQNFVPNAKAVAAGATLRPGIMWGIIGATCLTSPLCLSMLRRYVEEPEVAGKVSIKQAVDEVEMEEQLCLHGSDVSSE